jgi:hypothetical protein
MLFREIIADCCKNHMKHANTPCGQNVITKCDGRWVNNKQAVEGRREVWCCSHLCEHSWSFMLTYVFFMCPLQMCSSPVFAVHTRTMTTVNPLFLALRRLTSRIWPTYSQASLNAVYIVNLSDPQNICTVSSGHPMRGMNVSRYREEVAWNDRMRRTQTVWVFPVHTPREVSLMCRSANKTDRRPRNPAVASLSSYTLTL